MILDIKWKFPENGHGDARLMALVAETKESLSGNIQVTGKPQWQEVRVETKELEPQK